MKRTKLIMAFIISASLLNLTSCKKDEDLPKALDYINDITGTYTGTYNLLDGSGITDSAIAEVKYNGGTELEIHCYGDLLDTTFVMDIYANHDSIMVCATGGTFEYIYGHTKGEYHMNHHGNSQTEWMHHLEDDHGVYDEHFGGFDMSNHTFGYTFNMVDGNYRFQGIRK